MIDKTQIEPVARVAPDALVADGSNFFAYCGYDPVNSTDTVGGWKVPRPIPLPGGGSKKPKRQINMPVGIVEGIPPEMQTSDDEILPPVEGGEGSGAPPPQLPDMRQGDWSGQGSPDRVVSPGPDVAKKNEIGGNPIVATVNRLGRIAAIASARPMAARATSAVSPLNWSDTFWPLGGLFRVLKNTNAQWIVWTYQGVNRLTELLSGKSIPDHVSDFLCWWDPFNLQIDNARRVATQQLAKTITTQARDALAEQEWNRFAAEFKQAFQE